MQVFATFKLLTYHTLEDIANTSRQVNIEKENRGSEQSQTILDFKYRIFETLKRVTNSKLQVFLSLKIYWLNEMTAY
jgi:hypothetical protein